MRMPSLVGPRAGRLALIRFAAPGLGLVTDLAITRLIGVDGLGRYAVVASVAALIAIVASLGLQGPVNRELAVAGGADDRNRLATSALTATAVASLLLAAIVARPGRALLDWWNQGNLAPVAPALAAMMVGLAFQSLAVALARGYDRLMVATLAELVVAKLALLVALGAMAAGLVTADLDTTLWLGAGAAFVPLVAVLAWLTARDGLRPTVPDIDLISRLSFSSWALLGHQIVFAISTSVALWILDGAVDSRAAGLFYLVSRLAALVGILATVVQFLYANQIATAYRDGVLDRLQPTIRAVVTKASLGAVAVTLGLAVIHRPVLGLLTGEAVPWSATTAFVILALGQLAQVGTGPSGYALIMARRETAILTSTAIGAVAATAVAALLTPRFGIVGAAAATTFGQLTINGANLALARRLIGFTTSLSPRLVTRLR